MAFTWQNMATAIVLTVFCVIPFTTGLYFHIGETERKCFIEEIPDETMVTGNYKVYYTVLSSSVSSYQGGKFNLSLITMVRLGTASWKRHHRKNVMD